MSTDRRTLLIGGGELLLAFALAGNATAAPGDPAGYPDLDARLRIDDTGRVTLLTGKVELGQGILTALAQLCAEQLDVSAEHLAIVSGDTAIVPDDGPTVGSFSVAQAGTAVRQAASEVRTILVELAAALWGVA